MESEETVSSDFLNLPERLAGAGVVFLGKSIWSED